MILEIRHEESGEVRTVPLGAEALLIGKHAECDVVLADGRVSKRHARIAFEGDACRLEDLGSTNGTWVNEKALTSPVSLAPGSEFVIGPFRVRIDAGAERTAMTPIAAGVAPLHESVETTQVGAAPAAAAATPPPVPDAAPARPAAASAAATPPPVPSAAPHRPAPAPAAPSVPAVDFGPLAPLLADDGISEIMVNGPDEVFVERGGRLEVVELRFPSAEVVADLARAIAGQAGLSIDARRPMVDARLPDGSRMNAILPPLSLRGPCLTIRRFPAERLTAERLVAIEALNPPMLEFLKACVAGRQSLLVSGGTGSGKTTLLNALCAYIGAGERVVTIEDAAELRLPQRHVLPLETRPPDPDGAGEVSVRDLVRNALRMRPSRIVVGEVRGAEALDMLQAMNTGHEGSLSTIHANSPREALSRLETLVLYAGVELPIRAIREQVCGAIRLLVQVERLADAKRRVTSIAELSGMEGDTFTIGEIFRWEKGPDGSGKFRATGYVPRLRDRLVAHGQQVDNSWFH